MSYILGLLMTFIRLTVAVLAVSTLGLTSAWWTLMVLLEDRKYNLMSSLWKAMMEMTPTMKAMAMSTSTMVIMVVLC